MKHQHLFVQVQEMMKNEQNTGYGTKKVRIVIEIGNYQGYSYTQWFRHLVDLCTVNRLAGRQKSTVKHLNIITALLVLYQ